MEFPVMYTFQTFTGASMKSQKTRGSVDSQYARRQTAIKMIESHILSYKDISKYTNFSYGSIRNLASQLKHKTISQKKPIAKRGKPLQSGALLNLRQANAIIKLIRDKTPQQLKLPCMLWSVRMVHDLINQRYNITLAESTMRNYLKKWGFTVQRPAGRYNRRDDVVIENWLSEKYPEIRERAKKEDAEIHWLDETGVDNRNTYLRGFSPKGKTPVLVYPAVKARVSVISTVSAMGTLRFRVYDGSLSQKIFLDFLEGLCQDAKKKIFVVMDNLPLHKAKGVQAWLKENETRIAVFYLPPYAPERNPDEYLNHDLKSNVHRKGKITLDKNELKKKVVSQLRSIQKQVERVRGYFNSPLTQYAAI